MAAIPVRSALRPHPGSIDPEVAAQPQNSPAKPSAKRPDIKVTASRPENRFVGPLPIAIGLVALAALIGFAIRAGSKVEDPHFLRATETLALYEAGRPELERNYDAAVYTDALGELAQVDRDSISAAPAAALASDITFRTDAFHRRVKALETADNEILDVRQARDKETRQAQQRSLLSVRKVYPECDERGKTRGK